MRDVIRVQNPSGRWETLGVDRAIGAQPEAIAPSWAVTGPDSLTFTLRRDPLREQPELAPFAAVEYLPGGENVTWSGFVNDTPASTGEGGQITVNCRGWYEHGQHGSMTPVFVHDDMTAWQDARAAPGADLGYWRAQAQVTADSGIVLSWPQGAPLNTDDHVGVYLDLGPTALAAAVSITGTTFGVSTGSAVRLGVRGAQSVQASTGLTSRQPGDYNRGQSREEGFDQADIITIGPGIVAFPTGRWRTVIVLLRYTGPSQTALAIDVGLRLTVLGVATEPSYYAGAGVGVMTGDIPIRAARAASPLWSSDETQIAKPAFAIRHLADINTDSTPTALMERANSYYGWRLKVDHLRRVVFLPQPDRPLLRVSVNDPGVQFQDASKASTEGIYNHAIVTGASGSGQPLRENRYAGGLPGTPLIGTPQDFVNPTFTTSLTGWEGPPQRTDASVPWGRSASVYRTAEVAGSASMFLTHRTTDPAWPITGHVPTSDVYVPTEIYVVRGWWKATGITGASSILASFGTGVEPNLGGDRAYGYATGRGDDWTEFRVAWSPARQVTGAGDATSPVALVLYAWDVYSAMNASNFYFDDFSISRAYATLPDRLGFKRSTIINVSAPTDPAALRAIGDGYLLSHTATPMKGTLTVESDTAVRTIVGGIPVPVGQLGLYTTELILLDDLIDPANGAMGRNAVIVSVQRSENTATIALDNERANFQTLLNRIGVQTQ